MPINDWTDDRLTRLGDASGVPFDTAKEISQRTDDAGLRFIIPGDPEWPAKLDDLVGVRFDMRPTEPPVGLWVTGPGNLAEWTNNAIAMVGSRAATRYGESVAMSFAQDLASGRNTFDPDGPPLAARTIMSGGAFGIDAASHRGALQSGGRTIAVAAGGLDINYPPGNSGLLDLIREKGLMVSEYPPGMAPQRPQFLERNRLIAALSDGVVVVEAALRSGARNTASWAHAIGRPIMAVPGPVTSAMSVTPHRLIQDGRASLVTTPADVEATIAAFKQRGRGWDTPAANLAAQANAQPTMQAATSGFEVGRYLADAQGTPFMPPPITQTPRLGL